MAEQRDIEETGVIEVDAVLEHLEQVKEDMLKLIFLMQRERERKTPKSRSARRA
jgi:hypothetical protein